MFQRPLAAFGIPLAAAIAAGIIIFVLSRVLLAFNRETTPPVALGIALVILIACGVVASRYDAPKRVD